MARFGSKIFASSTLLVALATAVHAQTPLIEPPTVDPYTAVVGPSYGYTAKGSAAAYQSIAGKPGTLYLPLGGGVANPEDDGYAKFQLPFSFALFGTNYTSGTEVYLSANGYMLFGTLSIAPVPTNLLTDGASFGNQPAIAPFFTDMVARGMQEGGPGLYAQVLGSTGNRQLTIEWSSMQDYNNGNPSDIVSFQLRMFEGTDRLQFNYESTLFGTPADNGKMATVGIRDTTFSNPPDNVLQWGFLAGTISGVGVGLGDDGFRIDFNFSSVPEPTSIALCALGGTGVAFTLWRKRMTKKKGKSTRS